MQLLLFKTALVAAVFAAASAMLEAQPERIPCPCFAVYDPVCGKDGKVYGNSCEAKCAGVPVSCKGNICPCPEDCPPDAPLVLCKANPCDVTKCRAYPFAKCEPNFCGGCNAVFFMNGRKVDCDADICKLPKDTGPCRAAIPRYWFNSRTGRCEKFTYGGCLGNANNFETLEECKKACGQSGDCVPAGKPCTPLGSEISITHEPRRCCKGLKCCTCSGFPLTEPRSFCQTSQFCICPIGRR